MAIGEMRRIALVGRSGAGKSTLGPFLAKELGFTFVDMDDAVLSRLSGQQANISERRQLMADLLDRSEIVIAAGCEDFYEEVSRDDILSKALSIWIIADTTGRAGKTILCHFVRSLDEQAACFRAADLHVDACGLSVFEAVSVLVDHVRAIAAGVNLSGLRRHEIGLCRERRYQNDNGGRSRQVLENDISWKLIDALLTDEVYRKTYVAYSGLWHSEGRKVALVSADPGFATLEFFFFEHTLLPWETNIVVHRSDGFRQTIKWHSDCSVREEIRADLWQQLVNAARGAADSGGSPASE